jgi:hypothetical protein
MTKYKKKKKKKKFKSLEFNYTHTNMINILINKIVHYLKESLNPHIKIDIKILIK